MSMLLPRWVQLHGIDQLVYGGNAILFRGVGELGVTGSGCGA
nr:hypothetical protein [Desulfosediminicola ganghwensis]